ncbi:hypothetical protein SmJEL517_g04205 [Synchytrium microbalum]|uniref:[histone H3]-dimethyl-L-lysine(36) demethylase n=1 Tax=Synchytrium microbalum TaxID=1806994 RepID=A0A507C0W3_9FUNG|nr:uncharacterized protein SmJEL517_g04205 [Synchytrium microbalum]TPX32699.1 hypothetical protein SmJEL517_g04205 [Synchytrium microbalum]
MLDFIDATASPLLHKFTEILKSQTFGLDDFDRISGLELTVEWIKRTGFRSPIVIDSPEGLDMMMPETSLNASQIADLVGRDVVVEAMEVSSQSEILMNLGQWAVYFDAPVNRTRILNLISLEVSKTRLGNMIKLPRIVREIDWMETVWPSHKRETNYPKVQRYCLMSVKHSYTDFHIDFGGSSVYYHILRGEKIFFFVEPTPANLEVYEKWSVSPNQADTFFPDLVDKCVKVRIKAGSTLMIPTGWIHAVYTPVDSIVIGGNFLHGFNIGGQIEVRKIELRTAVPVKFTFPFFDKMMWYASQKYAPILEGDAQKLCIFELDGLCHLADYLEHLLAVIESDEPSHVNERKRLTAEIPVAIQLRKPFVYVQDIRRMARDELSRRAARTSSLGHDNVVEIETSSVSNTTATASPSRSTGTAVPASALQIPKSIKLRLSAMNQPSPQIQSKSEPVKEDKPKLLLRLPPPGEAVSYEDPNDVEDNDADEDFTVDVKDKDYSTSDEEALLEEVKSKSVASKSHGKKRRRSSEASSDSDDDSDDQKRKTGSKKSVASNKNSKSTSSKTEAVKKAKKPHVINSLSKKLAALSRKRN